jgi:hypothetical protein
VFLARSFGAGVIASRDALPAGSEYRSSGARLNGG